MVIFASYNPPVLPLKQEFLFPAYHYAELPASTRSPTLQASILLRKSIAVATLAPLKRRIISPGRMPALSAGLP